MRAWHTPKIPELPGAGCPLRLRDTATGKIRPSASGARARMYVCGITPYDATHLGHAFTYLTFDLVQRVWRDAGHDVHYVQNVTDVDDPLLERARQTGQDWRELAEREIQRFRDDMTALRIIPPSAYVGAVEAIPQIVEAIVRLREKDAAYEVERDIYFPVGADPRFGSIGHLDRASMTELSAARGGDPHRPGKKDPLDTLLWQAARPHEPAWDSVLGAGRPGWHVECCAISLTCLGTRIDVQGGGADLIFPHHEMGTSQARVLTGDPVAARLYVHGGLVGLDGEKMSKSRGNLVFVSEVRRRVDPMALRLALLAHRYRDDWMWSDEELDAAATRLARWRAATRLPAGPDARPVLQRVRERLADDLDTPAALRVIDRWCEVTLRDPASGGHTPDENAAPRLVRDLADALLGIRLD